MSKWETIGNVLDLAAFEDRVRLGNRIRAPSTLMFDDYVRAYFTYGVTSETNGYCRRQCAYLDLDRSNLTKVLRVAPGPVLELGALGTFDEFGTGPISSVKHGSAVHAYYAGWTQCESVPFAVAIGYAVSSDDGKTYHRMGTGPVLSYSPGEPFVLGDPSIRRINDSWWLWYISGRAWMIVDGKPMLISKIRMASSVDGIDWRQCNIDTIPDKLGADEVQVRPSVIRLCNRYHLFFGYRQVSDVFRGFRMGYAFSDNLRNWTRADERIEISIADAGHIHDMQDFPHVFELEGTVHLLYVLDLGERWGFGLARLSGDLG